LVGGSGGNVTGLAAMFMRPLVGGSGGNVTGLAAMFMRPLVGGNGGNVTGLAAMFMRPLVGGSGGNVTGLATMSTCPLVGGSGGNVTGLASAHAATENTAAPKIAARIVVDLEIMVEHSLRVDLVCIQRVTQKGYVRYHKSNIAEYFFQWERIFGDFACMEAAEGLRFAFCSPFEGAVEVFPCLG
jgi:hypothetical protein